MELVCRCNSLYGKSKYGRVLILKSNVALDNIPVCSDPDHAVGKSYEIILRVQYITNENIEYK
jgi:hypothetical protein